MKHPQKAKAPAAPEPEGWSTRTVTIAGKGTIPLMADGAMRRVPCGKSIEISKAERAYLTNAGVKFL